MCAFKELRWERRMGSRFLWIIAICVLCLDQIGGMTQPEDGLVRILPQPADYKEDTGGIEQEDEDFVGYLRTLANARYSYERCNQAVNESTESPKNVTFALYNVWNFDDGGGWRQDRSRAVFNILRRSRADVIALNEVRVHPDKGSMFLDACVAFPQYKGIFQPAMKYDDGTLEGVALFSRLPFRRVKAKHLHLATRDKTIEDTNRRVVLGVTLKGSNARVLVSHLSFSAAERESNALGITLFAYGYTALGKGPKGPMVLLADFNAASEDDKAVKMIKQSLSLGDAHKLAPEPTYCNCGHETCTLSIRPDLILYSRNAISVGNAWYGPAYKGGASICASDHRAVFTTLLPLKRS